MSFASTALAFVAGILSTLSPCVLPLLPIILGTAINENRFGPVALAGGLAISFVSIGLFVATIGYGIGLDAGVFRMFGACLMITIGVVLLIPQLQTQFAGFAAPVSNWAQNSLGGFDRAGLSGQFLLGLLLGAVWSPCVGPTLGAASVLAAQGRDLGQVALVMTAFGVGAAVPLLALGLLSRETMLRWRGALMGAGQGGKLIVGTLFVLLGLLIVSGLDKALEAHLVEHSPLWLTRLTTRF